VERGMNVLALVKGTERYVFLYDDESHRALLQTMGRFAADADLSFTWYDAAVLSQSPFAQLLQLITWGALLPAALAGIVLTRRRWRAALPLHLVLLASLFATVVFYGTPRFTLPVAPYLLVFAAYSLCSASCQLRGALRRPASPPRAVAAGPPRAAAAALSSGAFPQPGNL